MAATRRARFPRRAASVTTHPTRRAPKCNPGGLFSLLAFNSWRTAFVCVCARAHSSLFAYAPARALACCATGICCLPGFALVASPKGDLGGSTGTPPGSNTMGPGSYMKPGHYIGIVPDSIVGPASEGYQDVPTCASAPDVRQVTAPREATIGVCELAFEYACFIPTRRTAEA